MPRTGSRKCQLEENSHDKNVRLKGMSNQPLSQARISISSDSDRDSIYALRHAVYAQELHQHATTQNGRLSDSLDGANE